MKASLIGFDNREIFEHQKFYEPRNFDQMNKFKYVHHKMLVLLYIWTNEFLQIYSSTGIYFMMEIFEFIHLIEIFRLVQIYDAQKFSRL